MVTVYGKMKKGYNEICNMKDNHPDMADGYRDPGDGRRRNA